MCKPEIITPLFVIEPYNNPASLRVDGGVVSTGNAVPITTAGDDHKWLKRASMQKLTDVTYHASQPSRTGPRAQACLMTELSDAVAQRVRTGNDAARPHSLQRSCWVRRLQASRVVRWGISRFPLHLE